MILVVISTKVRNNSKLQWKWHLISSARVIPFSPFQDKWEGTSGSAAELPQRSRKSFAYIQVVAFRSAV